MRNAVSAVLGIAVLASGATAAGAGAATTRYASPDGQLTPTGLCVSYAPCPLGYAISQASTGDTVVVDSGTYTIHSALRAPSLWIDIHGEAGKPRPVIVSDDVDTLVVTDPSTTVSYLDLENTHPGGRALSFGGAIAEQIVAHASGEQGTCSLTAGTTLRDSICVATAPNVGIGVEASATASAQITVRNVTAIGGNGGNGIFATASGAAATLDLRIANTIARGGASPLADDIEAETTDPRAFVELTVGFSDYRTIDAPAGEAGVDDRGGNVPNTPSFVDATNGDYHETAASSTIGKGDTEPEDGPFDVDGESRTSAFGAFTDIGGDQYHAPIPVDPGTGAGGGGTPGGGGGTPSGGGPGTTPAPDKTAPVLSHVSLKPSAFALTQSGRKRKPHVHYETTLSFTVSETAAVRGTVLAQAKAKGRLVGTTCQKQTKKNAKRRRCTRWVPVATAFSERAGRGASKLSFAGGFGEHTFKPGRYRMQLVATDAAKNRSRVKTVTFRIVEG